MTKRTSTSTAAAPKASTMIDGSDAIRVTITEAIKAGDTDTIGMAIDVTLEAITRTERVGALATLVRWADAGWAIAGACTVAGVEDLHSITQAHAAKCINERTGREVPPADAKRYLRAALYATPSALVDLDDAMGTDAGPASGRITDLLAWVQAHDAAGWRHAGSNVNGGKPATKADAIARVTKAKADEAAKAKADEAATAKAKAKAEAEALAAKVKRAKATTKVSGLVTIADLKSATDEQIRDTITTLSAVLADREAKAKADADAAKAKAKAEAKATAKAKADNLSATRDAILAMTEEEVTALLAARAAASA